MKTSKYFFIDETLFTVTTTKNSKSAKVELFVDGEKSWSRMHPYNHKLAIKKVREYNCELAVERTVVFDEKIRSKKLNLSRVAHECIVAGVSNKQQTIKELDELVVELDKLSETASQRTHYHMLSEWCNAVYYLIRVNLMKSGFINGSEEQTPDAAFWFLVNQLVSNITFSPRLQTSASPHHASAYERNIALISELKTISSIKKDLI